MSKTEPRKISQKQLLRVFADLKKHSDDRMCFLLGAGASVNSGISTGGQLAKRWYGEIKTDISSTDLTAWQNSFSDFDETQLAKFYTAIFKQRFRDHPTTGYLYLQDLMEKAKPSMGYLFLAWILANTHHKFVITTNFDHMVEDAIRLYTNEHPLVCGHESLAEYINALSIRPTIIKVHRDLLLHPFNRPDDTSVLEDSWKLPINTILQHCHIVVIGYGGNDGSLMDYLHDVKEQRKSIYWCYREDYELSTEILNILGENDYLVKIAGFDEFMLGLGAVYECTKDCSLEQWLTETAQQKVKYYKEELDDFVRRAILVKNEETNQDLLKLFGTTHWWQVQIKVNQESDNDRKQQLFEEGINQLPDSYELMGNYAVFLDDIRKDYDQAEKFYRKALELAPDDASYNNNYAAFLNNYAAFLKEIRKDYDQAESYYRKALELAPDDSSYNNNYAVFLKEIRKDHDQAESYYRKALELAPDDASYNNNYAAFLKEIRKDYDQAESYYRKALELAPDNAIINGNYANFLADIRKDDIQAESYYCKALELEPDHANNNGNYAGFLLALGRKAEANPYLAIAMQANDRQDLLLECWFYRLAHFPELHEQAKQEIEVLLKQGVRSIGWDFSANIARAEQDGYADVEELRRIAAEITSE